MDKVLKEENPKWWETLFQEHLQSSKKGIS